MVKSTTSADSRTTMAVDMETKVVFEWSMKEIDSKSVPDHLRALLVAKHNTKTWADLVKIVQKKMVICEKHNKPTTMYCNDCKAVLCLECDIKAHLDLSHDVLNFCRMHEVGYRESCLMCEKERWEGITNVPGISAKELKEKLDAKEPLVIIDLRNKIEYGEGHLPSGYPYHHIEFKYLSLPMKDEFKELSNYIEASKDKLIVMMSQSMPKSNIKKPTGAVRSFIAGSQIKVMFKANDVRYLDGGWTAFHFEYPKIVDKDHNKEKCRICRFYDRA